MRKWCLAVSLLIGVGGIGSAWAVDAETVTEVSAEPDTEALDRFANEIRKRCFQITLPADREACLQDLNGLIYPVAGSSAVKDYSWLAEQLAKGTEIGQALKDMSADRIVLDALRAEPLVWTAEQSLQAFASIDVWLARLLKDPYSVRAYALSDPFPCRDKTGLKAMCVCARYNGRNSHGAYVGSRLERFVFTPDTRLAEASGSGQTDARCVDVQIHAREPFLIESAAEQTTP